MATSSVAMPLAATSSANDHDVVGVGVGVGVQVSGATNRSPAILDKGLRDMVHAATQTGRTMLGETRGSISTGVHPRGSNTGDDRRHREHLRRFAKIRHRSSGTMTSSKSTTTQDMDPPVLSFWGPEPVPLPSRFARIKRNLINGHEAVLEASWARLIAALRTEVEHIEGLGMHLIPSIEFSDIEDPSQTTRFGRDLKRYGVGVVRGVVPKTDADSAVHETVRYVETKHDVKVFPQDPTCCDFFWTPAQVRTRAHPSVLKAQRFMMSLWESKSEDKLATRFPITYADRIRIHGTKVPGMPEEPKDIKPAPETLNNVLSAPKSVDDWVSALHSSAGIIAQVDNGSLERWEPDGYQRGGTYDRIFRGDWESYDPWECASRIASSTDLYNGYGACSIFRMFQGVLALSTIEPGIIRLLPSPKLAAAYFLLRPFFSPKTPSPKIREGPEWEAFLSPHNWTLDPEQNTIVHGAVPGHAQRLTEIWHPHLHLRRSMVTLPTMQSGDYVFWHPDMPYHITSNGGRPDELSMLVYVPAAPLTPTNALYLARQRKAFLRGCPGPDFDSTGSRLGSEAPDSTRLGEREIAEVGGPSALQAMGLVPWELAGTPPSRDSSGSDGGAETRKQELEDTMEVDDSKSFGSASSISQAEAEVVRLANMILFPDTSMKGFC